MRFHFSTIGALSALTTFAAAAPALADQSEGERLFHEGRALMLNGQFAEACPKIAESQHLEPHVGTLLNLAACHERVGKVATAWGEYQKALSAAQASGQKERAQLAQTRIETLQPRVPWLTLSVASVGGATPTVTLDGATIAPVAWGSRMPVDPGAHVVKASVAAAKPWELSFDLRESEQRVLPVGAIDPENVRSGSGSPPVVLDASPDASAASPRPAPRWAFEVGGFVAACNDDSGGPPGSVVGINAFAGVPLSDRIRLGMRGLIGPRLDHGSLAALGPSASYRLGKHISVGASLFLGYSQGRASNYAPEDQSIQLAVGAGAHLDWHVLELEHGSIALNVAPLFLAARRDSWMLPVGAAYHF